MDEMYTTLGAVDVNFEADVASNKAAFRFSRSAAVATQGYKTSYSLLPQGPLEQALIGAINDGKVEWDLNWVVVTELWKSAAFTTLISSANQASADISTNQLVPGGVFNVANIDVGVKLSSGKKMGYSAVAEAGVRPFFQIHRVIYEQKNRKYYLKRYGRNSFSFWPKK